MLVVTRFGIGIRDPAWYEHRLALLEAITRSSLLAQTDQDFEWVVVVDPELARPARSKLTEALSPFGDRAHVRGHGEILSALRELVVARRLLDQTGCLLVGRIDDDDAWARDTVSEVHARVEDWRAGRTGVRGYGLSFESGLAWTMYDMVDLDHLGKQGERVALKAGLRNYNYSFTSISGYTYAEPQEALTAVMTGHARVESVMRERGYAIDVVSTPAPRWLYCRHKQTDSPVMRGDGPVVKLTVDDLETLFGIDAARVNRYISESDRYGYVKALRLQDMRAKVVGQLKAIDLALAGVKGDIEEDHPLLSKRAIILAELMELSGDAIKNPDED